MRSSEFRFHSTQPGFSLVELIVVITILGVVALVAVPRFMGASGFSEFALQKNLQSALRNIQAKAMQDSSGQFCYRMVFDSTTPSIGPSIASYSISNAAASCVNSIDSAAPSGLQLSQSELDELGVTISTSDGGLSFSRLDFDVMGRPLTNVGSCATTCRISLVGEQTTEVCIASQGYIYAC